MRRTHKEFFGRVNRIAPRAGGALAQCAFCEWGRYFPDRKRKRYSALSRAAASLRAHAKREHSDRFLNVTKEF